MSTINKSDLKKAKVKAWLREKAEQAKEFYQENKQWIIPMAVATGGVILKQGSKSLLTAYRTKKQRNVKELYWYDPSAGHYWKLRRELDPREALEVDRRHQAGERYGDIFESMKLLK